MIVINWGGGTNSTALIAESLRRGIRPDLVVFSDTGSEMPHTYAFLEEFKLWLSLRGLSLHETRWERVREPKGFIPLHENCLRLGDLPSAVYGNRGCSIKYKAQPIDAFVESHPLYTAAIAAGERVERWLGYDDDEDTRGRNFVPSPQGSLFPTPALKWNWRAPLQEWRIGRARCVEIIREAGLSQPGKSSCFLCPHMRPAEIEYLKEQHPALYQKAIEIEDKARPGLRNIQGLGRDFSPGEIPSAADAAGIRGGSCGCFDDSELPLFSTPTESNS